MGTLAYGMTSSCIVFVSVAGALDDREWSTYLDYLQANIKTFPQPRFVVLADGSAPSSTQRARLNELLKSHCADSKIAVLTSSRLSIGVVTAMSWFVPGFKAFLPKELDAALSYLDLTSTACKEVHTLLGELQRKLGLRIALGRSTALNGAAM